LIIANEKYLLDTNSFIAPYRQYYSFEIAPPFWVFLEENIASEKVWVLDLVFEELSKGETKDPLKDWINSIAVNFLSRKNPDIVIEYGKVMRYIQESGLYNENALKSWAGSGIADPWLIAAAKARDYTIITFEQAINPLPKSKTGKIRIPDVCKNFGVRFQNLYYMLNEMGFSFK